MFKELYNKTIKLAGHKKSKSILGFISFIESFIFPIPPDVLIIPMTIARKHEWIRIALIATIGSILGACLGYLIGYVFFNEIGLRIFDIYGVDDACDLKQEQITMIQWLWFGSLAFVTSALGTTLAFASMVIKYPPTAPSGGGVISSIFVFFRRFSKELYGLVRRANYTLALIHRRLTRPKIKEIQVEREIIKEVIQEVPVEKIVIQEVPVEIVKKEIIHVPLFTQDVKAVTKDG